MFHVILTLDDISLNSDVMFCVILTLDDISLNSNVMFRVILTLDDICLNSDVMFRVILTSQWCDQVADIIPGTESRPDVKQVDGGGTNGDEGDIHPGSYL